jgi:hypothetical protein
MYNPNPQYARQVAKLMLKIEDRHLEPSQGDAASVPIHVEVPN